MGSSINPLYPTTGTATTDQIRANFLTGKNEIEALQDSTSTDGLKVTADDTAGLGAALGGTADGRIAFDTDKAVLVRDTDDTVPFWRELAQRRIRKGITAARPAAGGITDGNFCNLYYNTTTSKLQLDNGSSWIDIGPSSGGGSGGTLTEVIVPSVMPGGGSTQVTHPSVPLTGAGSGEIKFAVLGTVEGSSSSSFFYPTVYRNINVSGASWVQDSGAQGHFSVVPGPEIGAYQMVDIGTPSSYFTYLITAFTPPGTGASEVTLDTSVASGSIYRIRNLWTYYGADLRVTGDSTYTNLTSMSWAYSKGYTYGWALKLEVLTGLTQQLYGGGVGRAAFSFNAGDATPRWWTFDGLDWVPLNAVGVELDPADLEADGLQATAISENFRDNLGGVIPADDGTPAAVGWGKLRLAAQAYGPTLNFGILVGIKNNLSDLTEVRDIYLQYDTRDLVMCSNNLGAGGWMMGAEDFYVIRDDETHATFTPASYGIPTLTDVHFQVWTA